MPTTDSKPLKQEPRRWLVWLGIVVAVVFPSLVTWMYFFQAADAEQGVQRAVMAVMKLLQFGFPIAWFWFVLRDRFTLERPRTAGLALGLVFGVAVTACGWLVYANWLQDSPWFVAGIGPIRAKVVGFGLDSNTTFVALAAFYSIIHSLLEEYYWRWFVFGQLRQLLPRWTAVVASAFGFAAHHVLVLSVYFGWWSAPTLLLSSAVAVGGAFWAWLYDRTGSLYGPWLSHAVIDAGIFAIGYRILTQSLTM